MLIYLKSLFSSFIKDLKRAEAQLDTENVDQALDFLSDLTAIRNLLLSEQIKLFKSYSAQFPTCPNIAYQSSSFWHEVGNTDKAFSEAHRCVRLTGHADNFVPAYSRHFIRLALKSGQTTLASDELKQAALFMNYSRFQEYFTKEIKRLSNL